MSMYPACAILEYASIRLMLLCTTAEILPQSIVTAEITDSAIGICIVAWLPAGTIALKTGIRALKAAALPAVLMNAVTTVGAPSYTSGAHWWNGNAAILKERPTVTSAAPMANNVGNFNVPVDAAVAMAA